MASESFYCPVYEGDITDYDCAEISVGIRRGRFVNDGLPFLMDLSTAVARKHRCHACPRCSDYCRPPGLPLMQTLRHLGFPDDIVETEKALQQIDAQSGQYDILWEGPRIRLRQLPAGIQLWQELDAQLNTVHDVQAHFFSANAMYLKINQLIRHDAGGLAVRSAFTAEARHRTTQQDTLVQGAFFSPNLSCFDASFFEEDQVVAQVTAFPAKLSLFDSPEDYLKKREVKLALQSFVSGMSMPGADPKKPGADALLTGIVEKASLITNPVTGLNFYHLELKCLGLVFDVVAAADMFEQPPVSGNVLQGVFWLSARVLRYGYTGYEFEIDVSLPLTTARFEPIRTAIQNMQPSELLYCGIDPPLGDIVFVRCKAEVEGISVEFRLDPEPGSLEEDEPDFRILQFYPVTRETAIKIFEETLTRCNPPALEDASDETAEYLNKRYMRKSEK